MLVVGIPFLIYDLRLEGSLSC